MDHKEVTPEVIDKARAQLNYVIRERLFDYDHWWSYNLRFDNLSFFANIVCSLGATIAGLSGHPKTAGVFGAILTSIIAVQKRFPFSEEANWYGVAIGRCKILLNRTNSAFATVDNLAVVEDELNQLIAGEGDKTNALLKKKWLRLLYRTHRRESRNPSLIVQQLAKLPVATWSWRLRAQPPQPTRPSSSFPYSAILT